jgi:prolipoprotein diacylglyceryltransferase
MLFPLDLHLFGIVLPIHLITDIFSFYLGYHYYAHLRKEAGDSLSDERRFSIIIGAAVGALIGSRLLASLEHLNSFLHPESPLYYYANKTMVGGLIGGTIGVEITKKFFGLKTPTGDLFVFPIILGMGIGRIGCLLTGVSDETTGTPSALPWAFDQGDGISRHPTSLYEILFLVIVFFTLKQLSRKNILQNGILFRLFVVAYLLFRFAVEFIKPVEPLLSGLSAIQIACLLFSFYYTYTLLFVLNCRLTSTSSTQS